MLAQTLLLLLCVQQSMAVFYNVSHYNDQCGDSMPTPGEFAMFETTVPLAQAVGFVDLIVNTVLELGRGPTGGADCYQWVPGILCGMAFPAVHTIVHPDGTEEVFRRPMCSPTEYDCALYDRQCANLHNYILTNDRFQLFNYDASCSEITFFEFLYNELPSDNSETMVDEFLVVRSAVDGQDYQIPCFEGKFNSTSCPSCQDGLEAHPTALDEVQCPVCLVQCPIEVHTPNQQDSLESLFQVGGWINVLLSFWMVMTWLLQRSRRRFPSRFVLFFSMCFLLMSVAMVLTSVRGSEEMECKSSTVWQDNSDATCTIQAVLWVFGFLGMTGWWLAFCVVLFLSISLGKHRKNLQAKEWVFHACVWPLPVISCTVMLASGKITHDPGALLCFISSDSGSVWQYLLFWGPMCGLILAGTVCMSMVCFTIIKNARATRRWATLKTISRFMIFIPIYWMVVMLYLVFSLSLVGLADDLRVKVEDDYTRCVFDKSEGKVLTPADSKRNRRECREELLHPMVKFGFDFLVRLCFSVMGIIVVAVFGAQRSNARVWLRALYCILRRDVAVFSSTTSTTGNTVTAKSRTRTNGSRAPNSYAGGGTAIAMADNTKPGEAGEPSHSRSHTQPEESHSDSVAAPTAPPAPPARTVGTT